MNEKKSYTEPGMKVIRLKQRNHLLNVSGGGAASDIRYGGRGSDDEYGD